MTLQLLQHQHTKAQALCLVKAASSRHPPHPAAQAPAKPHHMPMRCAACAHSVLQRTTDVNYENMSSQLQQPLALLLAAPQPAAERALHKPRPAADASRWLRNADVCAAACS
jgi:hypothetical protein